MVNRRECLRCDRHVRAIRVSKRSEYALGNALARIVLPDRTPVSQLSLRPQLNAEVPSRIPINPAAAHPGSVAAIVMVDPPLVFFARSARRHGGDGGSH